MATFDAGDKQDEHDGAEKDEDGEARVSCECFPKGFEVRAEAVIRLRVLRGDASGDCFHFDGGLREYDAGGKAADYIHVTPLAAVGEVGGEDADGDEDVGAIEKTEGGRKNADDGEAAAVERDGASDHAGIAAEMRLPELITQEKDGSGSGPFFRRKQIAAENRADAE